MICLLVILIVLYVTSVFGCIEPLASRKVELNLPILLLILCPIVNTIIALKYAKWSDVKKIFTNNRVKPKE